MKLTQTTTFGATLALAAALWAAPAGAQPTAQLHVTETDHPQVFVERTGTSAAKVLFKLKNNGNVRFEMVNGANSWTFDNRGSSFTITKAGAGQTLFTLDGSGNSTVLGTSFAQNHVNTSSREMKEGFAPVNETEILERLVAMPVTEWQYKADASGERHIGPVAEDFQQAFGVSDGKHISTIDESGVTIAAIQGLHKQLRAKEDEIAALKKSNDDLALRLARLEERLPQ